MSDADSEFESELKSLRPRAVSPELNEKIGRRLSGVRETDAAAASVKPQGRIENWMRRKNLGVLDIAALIGIGVLLTLFARSQYNSWLAHNAEERSNKVIADDGDGKKNEKEMLETLSAEEKAKLAQLMKALAEADFDARQKAQKDLVDFGPKALPALEALKASNDVELQTVAAQIVRQIKSNIVMARLEGLAPGIGAILSTPDAEKRQDSILAWARTVDRRTVAPVLVEALQVIDTGPRFWGCCETLNYFEAPEADTALGGAAWATVPPATKSVRTCLEELYNKKDKVIEFTDAARKVCDDNLCIDQHETAPGRIVIANQTYRIGAGFFVNRDSKVSVMMPAEAAQLWKAWYERVKDTAEWQPGDLESPTPSHIAAWIESLKGNDLAAARRSMARLMESWESDTVRTGVQRAADAGSATAGELLIRTRLRGTGQILFNNQPPGEKMAVWTMNADGSGQKVLFPNDFKSRNWWRIWNGKDQWVLLNDWDTQGLYWWRPGMESPRLIEEQNSHGVFWRKDTTQFVYLKLRRSTGGPGTVKMYDIEKQQHVELKAKIENADYFCLSPDGHTGAFLRMKNPDLQDGAHHDDSLMTYNFDTGEFKERLRLSEGYQETGNGIQWSGDGRYLSYGAYTTKGAFQAHLWVIETESGKTENIAVNYRSASNAVWSPTGACLAFFADRIHQESKFLVIYEPGKAATEYPEPEKVPANHSCMGYVEWIDDGRLVVSSFEKKFFFDPAHPGPMTALAAGEFFPAQGAENTLKAAGETWMLSEAEELPGLLDRQVVLMSRDGKKVVPLTNRTGGCSSPCFIPSKK